MEKSLSIENIKTAKALATAVTRARKSKGLSQKSLADRMNMRQPTVSDIENDKGTIDSLLKIIQALEMSLTLTDGKTKSDNNLSKAQKLINLLEE